MDQQSRDVVTWVLGSLVSLSILAGLATRYVLFPWLRDKLLEPVRETHRQVSENGHVDEDSPTIPDRLEELAAKVDDATSQHNSQARDLRALTRVLDEHLRWSNRWVDEVDDKLERLENGEKRP
jgi:hypothetical protein